MSPTTCSTTPIIRRGYLGRFDTKTEQFDEGVALTGRPEIAAVRNHIVNDIVWYSESAAKAETLVRFDPKTEKFQTWAIPSGGGVVRNMMHTAMANWRSTESGEKRWPWSQSRTAKKSRR